MLFFQFSAVVAFLSQLFRNYLSVLGIFIVKTSELLISNTNDF